MIWTWREGDGWTQDENINIDFINYEKLYIYNTNAPQMRVWDSDIYTTLENMRFEIQGRDWILYGAENNFIVIVSDKPPITGVEVTAYIHKTYK